jgi:hypothetical protein
VEKTRGRRLGMNAVFTYINRATRRLNGRLRQSPFVVFSCGDSAGNVQVEMARIVKTIKMKKRFVWIHFERDETDVERRAKLFKKFTGKKNFVCEKLRNKKTGLEFEKNLSKALDLYYDWSPKIEEELPHILQKLSARKVSYGVFIIGSGGHSLSNIFLAKRVLESYEFAHTIAIIVEPEQYDVKSKLIYEKLISYLNTIRIFETHIVIPSKNVNDIFEEQDNQSILLLLANLQKNSSDNIGHLCSGKWWRLLTRTTINPFYKRWFSKRHHKEVPFEILSTTLNTLNFNEKIDANSIYSFAGDLRQEDMKDAFAKLSAQKRQRIIPQVRHLLIKINKRENVVVGKFMPVLPKISVDYGEFTELEYLMKKPQGLENDYYT